MEIKLPKKVLYILDKLEENGYSADVVGGPVRDYLLGKEPSDFDITTSALPEETKAVFCDEKTVDTGIKHGTVTLVLDGEPFEITTYRIDGEYRDSRHPDSVTFTDEITLDLSRRDFTVNAMAYSPRHGLTDPHGGRADVERRLLRAVGEPALRFGEDALRIMRCVRFSSTLGFDIEKRTREALFEKMELIPGVSKERIFTEWKKLLSGEGAYRVLDEYRELLEYVIPEIAGYKLAGKALFDKADFITRFMSLFVHLPDPASVFERATQSLRTDSNLRTLGTKTLASYTECAELNERTALILLMKNGEQVSRSIVNLCVLLGRIDESSGEILEKTLRSGLPYRIADLKIGGSDVIALGASGRAVGEVLSELLFVCVLGEVENERESLLGLAKKILARK